MCYLREFRVFVAVYEERSFSAAAKRENATQSAVSQRIRKLEEVLAVRLFNRNTQKVEPTPAGHVYYDHCLVLLARHAEATADLQQFRGVEGDIAVGIPPWMARHVAPAVIERFVAQHPNVSVSITEGDHRMLGEQIHAGVLNIAVVPALEAGEGDILLADTEGVLVSPGERPAPSNQRAPAVARDLDGVRLIVPQRGNPYRSVVDAFLARHGVRPRQILEFDSVFGTLGLVAKGDWRAILPAFVLACDPDQDLYNIQTIDEPPTFRLATLTSPAGGTDACRSFRRMLEAELSRITLNALPLSRPLVVV